MHTDNYLDGFLSIQLKKQNRGNGRSRDLYRKTDEQDEK